MPDYSISRQRFFIDNLVANNKLLSLGYLVLILNLPLISRLDL